MNGRKSVAELDGLLVEINGKKRRVCRLVDKVTEDTAAIKQLAKESGDVSNLTNQ